MSDHDLHDHAIVTDITLGNGCYEDCIIQEIDKGISFTATQQQLQTLQNKKQPQLQQQKVQHTNPKSTIEIKSENWKAQPCSINSATQTTIKSEKLTNTPSQCAMTLSSSQQVDHKPVIVQNVQTLKLPLPRNAKQNPIFIQPVNGNIPLQAVVPVPKTQPQIQTVKILSSSHNPVLKPGMLDV